MSDVTDPGDDLSHVLAMWADDRASRDLGMEALTIEVDHAVVRMAVTDAMVNGHAIAHGGFSSPWPTRPSPSPATAGGP